jgi:hypothetical protein
MDKKNILSSASEGLKTKRPAISMASGAPIVPSAPAGGWFGRTWRYLRGLDKLAYLNIALLALLCAMFCAMYVRIDTVKKRSARNAAGYTLTERTGVYDLTQRARRPNRPTVVVVSRRAVESPAPKIKRIGAPTMAARVRTITLPIRPGAVRAEMPAARKTVHGNIVIDGRGRNTAISPMTTVNGNLYLQNLGAWTLPCGTRVNGHLFVRDVKWLKFCGCFDVRGNIYVSANSAFGAIPRDASLGGRIIF